MEKCKISDLVENSKEFVRSKYWTELKSVRNLVEELRYSIELRAVRSLIEEL